MNAHRQNEWLVDLVRSAADSCPIPEHGHWVDDDELVTCFLEDLVGRSERARLIAHLADCSRCRKILAELVLVSAVESGKSPPTVLIDPARRPWWSRPRVAAPLALAASLFLALTAWWYLTKDRDGGALAEKEHPVDSLALLLDEDLSTEDRSGAELALEQLVYRHAASDLERGAFTEVNRLAQIAAEHGIESARLAKLRLQARLAVPHSVSLARAGAITDYGYDAAGSIVREPDPLSREAAAAAGEGFSFAIEVYPDDLELRLNYGQFLLRVRRHDLARSQFNEALRIEPDHAIARMGLGLADYLAGYYEDALAHFEFVHEHEPASAAALLNAAMCLDRLGRPEEAEAYRDQAAALDPGMVPRRPTPP
jgi:tetratricopeptide (TPR) repeat protein